MFFNVLHVYFALNTKLYAGLKKRQNTSLYMCVPLKNTDKSQMCII